jgi:hypothetical protein
LIKKIEFINENISHSYLNGYMSKKQESNFITAEIPQFEILLAQRSYYSKESMQMQKIILYNQNVQNYNDLQAVNTAQNNAVQNMTMQGVKYTIQQNINIQQQNTQIQ